MRTIARSLILPVLVAGLLLVPTWALAQGTTIADPTNASQRAGVVPCASATNANGCVKVDGSFGGPMPVTMSTSTGVTSDIAAWGKQWLTSPGRTASGSDVAVFESDGTLTRIQVGNAGPQNGTIFRSFDRGRSWVNGGTTTGSPFGARVRGMRKLASTYMVAGEGGLTFSNDLTNWVAGTGLPGGTIIAVEVQGSTVVAQAVTGSQLCRSTNVPANVATGAPTFTCTAPVGMNTANESQALVSPGPLRWLFLDGGGGGTNRQVFLSTNDGVTFTLQATLSALGNTNGESALTCVSTTTCLAAAGLALYQTTDAGVTWTRVLSASGANEFVAFINFGQGVVVAGTRDMNASPTPFRTTDSGASWQPMSQGNIGCSVGLGEGISTAITFQGSGFYICLGNNVGTEYDFLLTSPPAGAPLYTSAGEQLVGGTGTAGTPSVAVVTIQGIAGGTVVPVTGTVTVSSTSANQGTAAAGPAGWPTVPVQAATLLNAAPVVSGANAAASFPLTGAAGQRICIRVIAVKATGAAASFTLTVTDGATIKLDLGTQSAALAGAADTFIGAPLICGSTGNSMTVNIGAGGVGAVTTTSVVADLM